MTGTLLGGCGLVPSGGGQPPAEAELDGSCHADHCAMTRAGMRAVRAMRFRPISVVQPSREP